MRVYRTPGQSLKRKKILRQNFSLFMLCRVLLMRMKGQRRLEENGSLLKFLLFLSTTDVSAITHIHMDDKEIMYVAKMAK